MMKYLLSFVAIVSVSLMTVHAATNYENIDHNEEVTRRINLDPQSVVEIITDIKFRTAHSKGSDKSFYYYVIPRELEDNLVSLQARLGNTLEDVKVTREDHISPALLKKYSDKNDTSDVVFYKFEV